MARSGSSEGCATLITIALVVWMVSVASPALPILVALVTGLVLLSAL